MKKCKCCARCKALEQVIVAIWWMARRYADGRKSYAPSMFNDYIDLAIAHQVPLGHPDSIAGPPSFYAKQGS